MRWLLLPATLLGLTVAAACGDDGDTPFEPGLDPEVVAGVYDIETLTFDPDGSLPEVDIAERFDQEIPPRFVVARDLSFQLAFIDPATGRLETFEGTYTTQPDGIRLSFGSPADAQMVLLPQRLDLAYAEETGTLSFAGGVEVQLARLVELVPEWEEEQLRDPVNGALELAFTPRESN